MGGHSALMAPPTVENSSSLCPSSISPAGQRLVWRRPRAVLRLASEGLECNTVNSGGGVGAFNLAPRPDLPASCGDRGGGWRYLMLFCQAVQLGQPRSRGCEPGSQSPGLPGEGSPGGLHPHPCPSTARVPSEPWSQAQVSGGWPWAQRAVHPNTGPGRPGTAPSCGV